MSRDQGTERRTKFDTAQSDALWLLLKQARAEAQEAGMDELGDGKSEYNKSQEFLNVEKVSNK